jgi:2-polyprenyl-6-methoxyphenol hydroxylase-like FAD-dependent oxidoreductase
MEVERETQVLISGGGLVGLSTAMFLATHGIPSLVVERLKETSQLPRAAFFHMRTLELFREAGIEPAVREQSEREFLPDGQVVAVESLNGRQLAAFIANLNEGVADVSPCRRLFLTQPGLEPILRRRAEAGGASVMMGHELSDVVQRDDGVLATVKNVETGEEDHIAARYLVCAEGGHSRLREQLGIAMDGRGIFSRSLTIYFRADLAPYLKGRNLSIIYVVNPTLSGFFRLDKNSQRGFFAVNVLGNAINGENIETDASVDVSEERLIELVRIAAGVPDLAVEIEGAARWRCTADLAQRYRDGRIFLAGDAAHLMPPTGGFGGNTGVHDAHNLAWKLAMVLKGASGPALLDTYEIERRPVGHFTVEQAYTRYVTRTAPYLGAKDYQPVANDFAIELGYRYRSPAIIIGGDESPNHQDPRQSRGCPGFRAPHLWLEGTNGPVSTLDLFGRGFTLLAAPNGQAWIDAAAAIAKEFPDLHAHVVGSAELGDPKNEFTDAYGIGERGASLIRPDGFVAWRSTAQAGLDAMDELRRVLVRLLMRGPVS